MDLGFHSFCFQVTFKDPDAAIRACQNPSPVIDGRRANCNLASLGAHKPPPPTPQQHGSFSILLPFISSMDHSIFHMQTHGIFFINLHLFLFWRNMSNLNKIHKFAGGGGGGGGRFRGASGIVTPPSYHVSSSSYIHQPTGQYSFPLSAYG